jgi:hypothetical protein
MRGGRDGARVLSADLASSMPVQRPQKGLVARRRLCYHSPPAENDHETRCCVDSRKPRKTRRTKEKEVDDKRETLHNLISLLLTNKTLCRQVARQYRIQFFKN